jgi:CheY-like chemotaxis protein
MSAKYTIGRVRGTMWMQGRTALKVLIAEGSALMRTFLRKWCSELGIEVVDVAVDARQAVELARRTSPDAVLWDVRAPCGDELGLLQSLKTESQVSLLIVWSAFPSASCRERYLAAGADYYLDKTVDFEMAADLLRGERAESSE